MAGSFQEVVSGALLSFLRKYGDRAASTNLCKPKDSFADVTMMSDVFGWFLTRSEETCEANG